LSAPNPPGLILFADDTVVFAAKPSGLLVHNSAYSGPRERTFVDIVRTVVGQRVAPIHRLDRAASGVVAFARPPNASMWQHALQDEQTEKHYVALVRGRLLAPVLVDHPITDETGVKRAARSLVLPLATCGEPRCSLVLLQLLTGRRHQARRHLKHLDHPVIGDANYGKGPLNREFASIYGVSRLALHAISLACIHPIHGTRLVIRAPLPEDLVTAFSRIFSAGLPALLT